MIIIIINSDILIMMTIYYCPVGIKGRRVAAHSGYLDT